MDEATFRLLCWFSRPNVIDNRRNASVKRLRRLQTREIARLLLCEANCVRMAKTSIPRAWRLTNHTIGFLCSGFRSSAQSIITLPMHENVTRACHRERRQGSLV